MKSFMNIKYILITTTLLIVSSLTYSTECRESKLSFIPYSSSINGSGSSHLTEAIPYKLSTYLKNALDKQIIRYEELYNIDPQISYNNFNQNIIKRYDLLQFSIRGERKLIFSELRQELYDKNAADWEGLCNQYSAASLNPRISGFLNSINGVLCPNNILFSKEEISELFTAFYKYKKSDVFFGTRNYLPISLLQKDLVKEFGFDELKPNDIVNFLHQNLSSNQGVVFDSDLSDEVWNKPIFNIKSCTSVENNSHLDNETLKYLPLKYLTTKNKTLKKLIRILSSTQLQLEKLTILSPREKMSVNVFDKTKNIFFKHLDKKRNNLIIRKNTYYEKLLQKIQSNAVSKIILTLKSSKALKSQIPDIMNFLNEKSSSPIYYPKQAVQFRYFALKEYIQTTLIKNAITSGEVVIKHNLEIKKHKSKVVFKKYNGFTTPLKLEENSLRGYFEVNYLSLKDDKSNEVRWISDSSLIPDFLWIPPKKPQYDKINENSIKYLWDSLSNCKIF